MKKADISVARTNAITPPLYDVSFRKGDKVIVKNKKVYQYQPGKGGEWHGTEQVNGESKFTLYLTLNDVLYGTSII